MDVDKLEVFFDPIEDDGSYTVKQSSRRKNRKERKRESQAPSSNFGGLHLRQINPQTRNQGITFQDYQEGYNLMLHGVAGSGKTFIALYLALNEILNSNSYKKLVIVRSTVPTRDQGFLPGNAKEKAKIYESPYYAIFTELFGRGDAYDCFKNKGTVDFISSSYIRGTTIHDSIVIVDECQNLNFHELDSIITRLGKNSKVIFCGDFRQSDLLRDSERNGLLTFQEILDKMKEFRSVEFEENDIVRSGLVRSYIIKKLEYGIT